MGDITCRICGEPWDAYGVYHDDMTASERARFLAGKGCPSCKGNPYKCELPWTYHKGQQPDCEFWDWGRCTNKDKCDHKYRPQEESFLDDFLHGLTNETDDDPIKLLNNVRL